MQDYSFSDINDAKRRVQEMKNKAKEHTEEGISAVGLISSLQSPRDRAFIFSLIYLMTEDSPSEALINTILYILNN